MMNERKSYTAQEMREMEAIVASGDMGSITRERVAIMLKQAAEMYERAEEVAELRECLEQAYGDKIGTYTMKGNEVGRWRKALEGAKDEGK